MPNIENEKNIDFKIEKREPRNEKEFMKLVDEIGAQIDEEKKDGFGKLDNIDKIPGIKEKEAFVDRKVAYLPDHGEAIFVGDTHGEVQTFEKILNGTKFAERAKRGEDVYLVMLGDYVDRGKHPLENLETILNLKKAFGKRVVMIRGNHDFAYTVMPHEFPNQVEDKFGKKDAYWKVQELFNKLPHTIISKNGLIGMHGGCPSNTSKISALNNIGDEYNDEVYWNDPDPNFNETYLDNGQRGAGKIFGRKAADNFLNKMGGVALVRSHQYDFGGYAAHFDGKVITIFSASLHRVGKPSAIKVDLGSKMPINYKLINVKLEDANGYFQYPKYDGKVMNFENPEKLKTEKKIENIKTINKNIAESRKWVEDNKILLSHDNKILEIARALRKGVNEKSLDSNIVKEIRLIEKQKPLIEIIFDFREKNLLIEDSIALKRFIILQNKLKLLKPEQNKETVEIRKQMIEIKNKRIEIHNKRITYQNERIEYFRKKIKR
jgi:predicted phosphodiesterase